jgi:hypothetical protein
MIDWVNVYHEIMRKEVGKKILPHIAILGGFIILGLILGVLANHNLTLIFLIWLIGGLVDYLIYSNEIVRILTKNQPYYVEGVITHRVKKILTENDVEYEKLFFEIEVADAFILDKGGLSAVNYLDKEGDKRFEVPESMFLSLRPGEEVALVCTPNDRIWGWVNEDEVVYIEE